MQLLTGTLFFCMMAVAVRAAELTVTVSENDDNKSGMDKNSVITCEGFEAQLQCPPNMLIEVTDAFYGRTNDDYCVGPKLTDKCSVGSVARVLASVRCNYKNSCKIPTQLYADPCVGTHKFLKVTYSCKALPTAVICDGAAGGFQIKCPPGMFIATRDAFYGRMSDEHCAFGPRLNYACSLANAKAYIANTCTNKESCALGFTSDPCPGTLKYMTAIYECLDYQTQVACDGQQISISCPAGKTIRVLSGFFGRTSDEVCTNGPRLTYDCSSSVAAEKIPAMCNNKPTCQFNPAILGDPCPGTFKYAQVKYRCT